MEGLAWLIGSRYRQVHWGEPLGGSSASLGTPPPSSWSLLPLSPLLSQNQEYDYLLAAVSGLYPEHIGMAVSIGSHPTVWLGPGCFTDEEMELDPWC